MARKNKPNFNHYGNKKSGNRSANASGMLGFANSMENFGAPKSKKFNNRKQHHDTLNGNRGNGGGRNKRGGFFG